MHAFISSLREWELSINLTSHITIPKWYGFFAITYPGLSKTKMNSFPLKLIEF